MHKLSLKLCENYFITEHNKLVFKLKNMGKDMLNVYSNIY